MRKSRRSVANTAHDASMARATEWPRHALASGIDGDGDISSSSFWRAIALSNHHSRAFPTLQSRHFDLHRAFLAYHLAFPTPQSHLPRTTVAPFLSAAVPSQDVRGFPSCPRQARRDFELDRLHPQRGFLPARTKNAALSLPMHRQHRACTSWDLITH